MAAALRRWWLRRWWLRAAAVAAAAAATWPAPSASSHLYVPALDVLHHAPSFERKDVRRAACGCKSRLPGQVQNAGEAPLRLYDVGAPLLQGFNIQPHVFHQSAEVGDVLLKARRATEGHEWVRKDAVLVVCLWTAQETQRTTSPWPI